MIQCTVSDINDVLLVEDWALPEKRDRMLGRIYGLTGCSMRSQKRLWKSFGESASIKLFDKMDEFLNAANNLYALFDKVDEKETPLDQTSFEVYKTMMAEFVRSRNVWVRAYDKGLIKAREEATNPKCGQQKKGYAYGDFS